MVERKIGGGSLCAKRTYQSRHNICKFSQVWYYPHLGVNVSLGDFQCQYDTRDALPIVQTWASQALMPYNHTTTPYPIIARSRLHQAIGTGRKCPSLSYFASTTLLVQIFPKYPASWSQVQLTKESIIQRHSPNILGIDIIHKIGINIKEHRHIHRLPGIQPLLLKAKTLDLAEISSHLSWRDAVCCHAYDVLVRCVRCCVEC